jgi:hypothetical protein
MARVKDIADGVEDGILHPNHTTEMVSALPSTNRHTTAPTKDTLLKHLQESPAAW